MPVLIPVGKNDLHLSIIHGYRIGAKSRIIYTTVILSVIFTFAPPPFISSPVILTSNEDPAFKVQRSPDKDQFELNGARAYLKKGMGFTARFSTGDFNLLPLLLGRADKLTDPDFQKQRRG